MKSKAGVLAELWSNRAYYLMAVPALLVIFLFAYLPYPGIIIAFKNYNLHDGMFGSPWSGFENFKFFFTSGDFVRITFNTLWINFNQIFWGTIIAVLFALFINEIKNQKMKKLFQSFIFLPYFFSFVIVGKLVLIVFKNDHGLANELIHFFHGDAITWYTQPQYWVKIIVSTSIWKNVGYTVIIYLATITGIDEEILEASSLDGASRLQQIRYIILPSLVTTIIILTLLAVGRIFFGDFALIYSIIGGYGGTQNGLLLETTDVIDTYIYRALQGSTDYGMIGAVSVCQSIIGFILVVGSNSLVKKYDKEYALF